MIGGQIVGFTASILFGLFSLRNTYAFVFSKLKLKKMLVFSAPLVPASMAVFFMNYSDRLMINHFFSVDELGIYGIAFRISSVVSLLLIGVRSALMPLIYANFEKKETSSEIEVLFRYFTIAALLFFISLSLFSRLILEVFTTESFYSAYQYVPILVLGILFSQSYIFMPGASIKKKTKYFLIINSITAGLNIVFNLILIPRMGLIGVALATMLAHLISFTFHYFISQKYYYVSHQVFKLSLVLFYAMGVVYYFINYEQVNRILLVVILNISFLILVLGLGIIKKDEIIKLKSIVKSKIS